MMILFISRNFGKLVNNLKQYKTKLYFAITVSVIEIDNDFNHRNQNLVSEPLKFRRYLYFRQVVRSSNCPFGKMSVRQNVRSAKCLSVKCLSAKCLWAKCPATIQLEVGTRMGNWVCNMCSESGHRPPFSNGKNGPSFSPFIIINDLWNIGGWIFYFIKGRAWEWI